MWTLLRSSLDWEKHCQEVAKSTGATGTLVNWGRGPQSYPCLVASYAASPLKIVSAYVYQADAVSLLQAADQHEQHARVASSELPAAASNDDQVPPGSRQADYNKSVSAHLLAIIHFLTETRICKREQYDAKYTEALACVDEWSAEDRDRLLAQLGGMKNPLDS